MRVKIQLSFNWNKESVSWGHMVSVSVQFSHSVVSSSLRPHGLQHARLPCPSPTPRACSNSYLLSRWCHPTISSCVVPFSSCLQSFPSSESFTMNQFFTSGGQSIEASASASVLPMNIQDWFPLGLTGLYCLSLLQQIFPTQESNWGLLCCRWILYQLSHQGIFFISLMSTYMIILKKHSFFYVFYYLLF